jgi:hypothetical protein
MELLNIHLLQNTFFRVLKTSASHFELVEFSGIIVSHQVFVKAEN